MRTNPKQARFLIFFVLLMTFGPVGKLFSAPASTNKATLVVEFTGKGSISPNYNGQLLQIGKSYTMRAIPAVGFGFGSWTGSVPTNKPKVTFVMESNITLIANFVDVMPPILSVKFPPAREEVTSLTISVSGTARDNVAVAAVYYQVNGGPWTSAQTENNWTNWTASVPLIEQANIIRVYAVDTVGNASRTNGVTVTYQAPIGIASLSATNGEPFSILQIKATGLAATNPIVVKFFDSEGFAVMSPVAQASNGAITVGVPPYLNPKTNIVQGAPVSIQVLQTNGFAALVSDILPFTIEAPPNVLAPPGEVTYLFLQACLNQMTQLESNIRGTVLDTPAMNQALSENMSNLSTLLDGIQGVMQTPSVPYSLGSAGQTRLVVDAAALSNLDRLIRAFLQSQASDGLTTGRAAERLAANSDCTGQAAANLDQAYSNEALSSGTAGQAAQAYYNAPVNCLPSAANTTLTIVGASAGVVSAVFVLLAAAAGAELSADAALVTAAVLMVTVVVVGGVIAVEGAVGQKTPALAQDIQEDLKTLNSAIIAPAVDGVLGWITSESATALYDLASSGKDLYNAFSEVSLIPSYTLTIGT